MIVGVVGSRTFKDQNYVFKILDHINAIMGFTRVVSGGAKGVDTFAKEWAELNQIPVTEHLPDLSTPWSNIKERNLRYYDRNRLIVKDSDLVVAFIDKPTGGTWNTIEHAWRNGKEVWVLCPKEGMVK